MRPSAHNDYYAAVARDRWSFVSTITQGSSLPVVLGGDRKRRKRQFSRAHFLRINNAITKLAPIEFTSTIQ